LRNASDDILSTDEQKRTRRQKIIAPRSVLVKVHYQKKKSGEIREFLSTYGFCPGGAAPDGFWFSVCCVCPAPVHVGC
jgi:hypothetical protein